MQRKESMQRILLNPASMTVAQSIFAGLILDHYYRQGKTYFAPNELHGVDKSICSDDLPDDVKQLFANITHVQFSYMLTAAENASSMTGVVYYLHDDRVNRFRNSFFNNIAGILKPQANGELRYKNHKQRLAKCWQATPEEAKNENNLTRRHTMIAAKPLSNLPVEFKKSNFYMDSDKKRVDMNVMVMRKLPGVDLLPLLLEELEGKTIFTLEQRLQLSRQLMRALIEQVQMNNIIHRDISAHNIRVDLSQANLPVIIFDFGMSIDKSVKQNPKTIFGTPIYMSPEVYDMKPATFAADIYSMAWVLAMLWRADEHPVEALRKKQMRKVVKTYKIYEQNAKLNRCLVETAHNCKFKHFFKGIDGLSREHKKLIANTIQSMVYPDPEKRPSAEVVYACFDDIVSARRINALPRQLRAEAKLAHQQGRILRDELQLKEWQDDGVEMFKHIVKRIKASLNAIKDEPSAMRELIETANLTFLSHLSDCKSISTTLDELLKEFNFLNDAFNNIKAKSSELSKEIDSETPVAKQNKIKHIAKRVASADSKYGEPKNLAAVLIALPKLRKYVDQLTHDIDQACSMNVTGPSLHKLTSM